MEKLEKNIYKISWPIFLELLFFTLLGTIDTLMLSGYSDTAVGSVGISNQILFLFGIIVNVIAIGIGVVSAQYLGAKQVQKAKDTIVTGIVGNLIIGIILSTIVLVFGRFFLQLIGTQEVLLDDAVTYIQIVGFSIVFISLRVGLSTGFRSFSHPKLVMVIMGIGNFVNVIINALLIYGLFGLPSLGVQGAAIGTLTARIVMVILLVIFSYKTLHIKLHKLRLHIVQLKKILYVGTPAALENIMYNISQVIIVYFVNQMGVEAVIARSYMFTILSFIFIFSFAFASGNSIIVGYHMGERQTDKAYKNTLKAVRISFILVIFITLLLNIFSYYIIGIFTQNIEITAMIRKVIYFAVFIELGRAMNLVYIHALRSVGDTVFPVVMAVISMFGVSVLFSYILGISLELGIVGVFLASMMDELIRGCSMAIRWYRRGWINIQIVDLDS